MRLRAKRRAVAALIAFVAVWPAVQHVVVERVGADPWLYFGMAMYCVPRHVSNMRVVVLRDGEPLAFAPERITPELNARLEQFRHFFRSARTWAPRRALAPPSARALPARALLGHFFPTASRCGPRPAPAPACPAPVPGADALSLTFTVDSIDFATGRVVGRDTQLVIEPPMRSGR